MGNLRLLRIFCVILLAVFFNIFAYTGVFQGWLPKDCRAETLSLIKDDQLTETKDGWDITQGVQEQVNLDKSDKKEGEASIKFEFVTRGDAGYAFLHFQFEGAVNIENCQAIEFWAKANEEISWRQGESVTLYDDRPDQGGTTKTISGSAGTTWTHYSLKVSEFGQAGSKNADRTKIGDIYFMFQDAPGKRFIVWIDGLKFVGPAEITSQKESTAYLERRSQIDDRLEKIAESKNYDVIPQYRTVISEDKDRIILKREAWTLVFQKETCSVKNAIIRGLDFGGVSLPNAVIIDEHGRRYEQNYARGGKLSCSDRKWCIEITGSCVPAAADGTRSEIILKFLYRLDKMTGLVSVQVESEGQHKVAQLTFENSLGAPFFFDYMIIDQNYDNPFDTDGIRDVGVQPVNEGRIDKEYGNRILRTGKFIFATWAGQGRGFQVFPVTWEGTNQTIDNARVKDYKFMTLEVRDRVNYIDLTFVNKPDDAISLDGKSFQFAFSLLPFKNYRFKPIFYGNLECLLGRGTYALSTADKEIIKKMADGGVNVVCVAGNSSLGKAVPDRPEVFLEMLEYCHKLGIKVVPYVDTQVWDTRFFIRSGLASKDEVEYSMLVHGEKKFPGQSCRNVEGYRMMLLEEIARLVDNFDIDGIYLDNFSLTYCQNTRHGCSEEISGNVYGINQFQKDVRNLLGEDKLIFGNVGSNAAAPAIALIDHPYSGEGTNYQKKSAIDEGRLNIELNSILTGCQHIPVNFDSYQMDNDIDINGKHPKIFEQLLKYSSILACNYWPNAEDDDPANDYGQGNPYVDWHYYKTEKKVYDRYTMPLLKFGSTGVNVHHPFDTDYGEYVYCQDQDIWVVLYTRKGECLAVVINEPHRIERSAVWLNVKNLPIEGQEVLVGDVVANPGMESPAFKKAYLDQGWLKFKDLDVSKGPRIFVIKEIP